MYDQATQSLWSTLWGRPVIGPLVGQGIELERLSVVTTTWGEWRRRYSDTKVLAQDTGHQRDYAQGAAYRDYYATDELMFPVPGSDSRLLNKQEILALQFTGAPPLAVAVDYLDAHPLWAQTIGTTDLVVLTDRSGANRAYAAKGVKFSDWDRDTALTDNTGRSWLLREDALVAQDGSRLERLPAHRAFWFGWRAAYPATRLISNY